MKLNLTNAIFLGILLAVILGLAANFSATQTEVVAEDGTTVIETTLPLWAQWLMPLCNFMGTLFLRAIKMLIAPLILTAIVSGIATIPAGSGVARLGFKTLLYYATTTALAVVTGLVLVNVIQPGGEPEGGGEERMAAIRAELGGAIDSADARRESIGSNPDRPESIGDLVMSLMSQCLTNPFEALAGPNVLGIITFSLLIGLALPHLGSQGKILIDLFESGFALMIKLITVLLWTAPFGAAGLLFELLAPVGLDLFRPLGWYMATVTIGLLIHGFLTLPLLLILFGRMSPWHFFRGFREALAVSLSTSSSSATLPVSIRCAEENLGVSNKTASFVLPLGSTVNMDGTALYEAVAALFIAQVYAISLGFDQMVLVFITATFAAIGAAGIPSAGLVTMFMVFAAVDIPAAGIALIITVDRVLDMLRTVINVGGDGIGSVIVARSEGEDLASQAALPKPAP